MLLLGNVAILYRDLHSRRWRQHEYDNDGINIQRLSSSCCQQMESSEHQGLDAKQKVHSILIDGLCVMDASIP